MTHTIGIYLEAVPYSGGMFQYNQTIIDAVNALPRTHYRIVIAYRHPLWEKYLAGFDGTLVQLPVSTTGTLAMKAWRKLRLPVAVWRRISRYVLPEVNILLAQHADLWIFPTQDELTYQVAGIRALGTVHDIMHRYEPSFPEVSANGQYRVRENLLSNIARYSRGVLVDSEYGKQQLIESYAPPPENVYPLPYIAPRYIYEAVTSADFDERYQLPTKFVFYPAQFWPHKNHVRLVEAIGELLPDIPDIQLVLVGSKNAGYETVVATITKLGIASHVHFMGYVPNEDMPEFYRRARALIMPTFFGPTNIPPLEAFALGCPVAVSGIYGIPEQVSDAALLFNPKSVDEMAAAIRTLWTDDALCRTLIERGKIRSQHWQQTHFTQRLHAIIADVLRR